MVRFSWWANRLIGLYILLIILALLFSVASTRFGSLAILERKLNPSTFVFWQDGELYKNPPLFTQVMADAKGQFASREPSSFEDVDIWVLILEGFADIKNVELAPHLGIDIDDAATFSTDITKSLMQVSLRVRLHPFPLAITRKHIVLVNTKSLRENFKEQCFDEITYESMIGDHDPKLWEQCRISATEPETKHLLYSFVRPTFISR
ncbi:hypothetical protein [Pseudovibrio sp. FO-BEG1]|uniref:hypothetical protein n=1 Tax=Pseudovibrio sp. (strain FO-BEG1) TaxID=911045 RepID=UPI00059F4A89|nr:hypothetical protein [Pseudovibrio sp. FO-BEG1]